MKKLIDILEGIAHVCFLALLIVIFISGSAIVLGFVYFLLIGGLNG